MSMSGGAWIQALKTIPASGRVFPEDPCARCGTPTPLRLVTGVFKVVPDASENYLDTETLPWCAACTRLLHRHKLERMATNPEVAPRIRDAARLELEAMDAADLAVAAT